MRRIGDAERRARLARRHALAPGSGAADVVEAAARVVGLHGTDPASVFLSARARVDGMTVEDLRRAIHDERALVRHLAMRRTLWVLPREALGDVQAGASDRVAAAERRRLARDVEKAGLRSDGARWLDEAGAAVVAALAGGRQASAAELRAELPVLEGATTYGEGKSWGGDVPVAPRVLTVLSASGLVVRGTNDGGWTVSRPRWALMDAWLGAPLARPDARAGLAGLVTRWLRAFGPGTAADLKWWLGSTVAAVRTALADVGAVEVALDDGSTGWVLADDLEEVGPVAPWAALLPSLDPTTMGWQARDWYLGPHRARIFDTLGNAGATAWWDGRIVGAWHVVDGGEVLLGLVEDVGAEGRAALEAEAVRLGVWIGDARIRPRFPSPLSRVLAGGGVGP